MEPENDGFFSRAYFSGFHVKLQGCIYIFLDMNLYAIILVIFFPQIPPFSTPIVFGAEHFPGHSSSR